ncbi:LysR substrate-binding domain-containing protein [Kiloniella laminariae]|uniref:LysR substrate-binding domain-containing protein n=1 Tax=Kiloniella laminariae TaxID=454162 RepID=UPI00052419FE|nr:LysR substrate-binding domain-containing protein [Kiloniella laminariae]
MRKFPPLSGLRAFEAVARHKNLSHAARELNVTHAAVAQQIKRLEEWFSTPLTRREGRGVAITEAGIKLGTALGNSFDIIDEVVQELQESDSERPLRITMTPSFATFWLLPRLTEFRNLHPEIELLLNANSEVIDIKREEYDLGIRYGSGDWAGYEVEKLMQSYTSIVVSPVLLEKTPVSTPQDITKLPWVCDIDDYHAEWDYWLEQNNINPKKHSARIHLPGHLMRDAIRDGQGVGTLPSNWVTQDITAGRLVELFSLNSNKYAGYYLVYKSGVIPNNLKIFLSWLRKQNPEDARF